ncbi:hypothetical protein KF913_23420 [Candidatus Obscuribacterales bacterium]|nr:hypothetical protein [Candidatus Obscuribacterales bacterium]
MKHYNRDVFHLKRSAKMRPELVSSSLLVPMEKLPRLVLKRLILVVMESLNVENKFRTKTLAV